MKTYLQNKYPQPNQNRQRLAKHTNPQPAEHTQDAAHADLSYRARIRRPALRDDRCLGVRRVVARQVVCDLAQWIRAVALDGCEGGAVVLHQQRCAEDQGRAEHEAAAQAGEEEGHFCWIRMVQLGCPLGLLCA
jgi:hypothetical protein